MSYAVTSVFVLARFALRDAMSLTIVDSSALERALTIRDLTDPSQGPSALQLLIDDAVGALSKLWSCLAWVRRSSPIVDIADNYDTLRYPRDDVTRAARYTRYVDERQVLRTHTSAMIPPLLRLMAANESPDDILLACPGITYRRDVVDKLHTGERHQLDLWRVRTGAIPLEQSQLLPERSYRVRETAHFYTQQGLEIYINSAHGEWIEIGECGLVHPGVLVTCGLQASHTSGLALGLGLDRLLMLRKGIDDVRLLRSTDPRVRRQLDDLQPYRPVSQMPAIRRDR
jgi:phenylalanyl-tRNA synthetase alpha chain